MMLNIKSIPHVSFPRFLSSIDNQIIKKVKIAIPNQQLAYHGTSAGGNGAICCSLTNGVPSANVAFAT